MLNIPFLSNYIQKIVKVQTVADSADWLNYYCTSLMLAFFSLAISAKQYFGSAIKCWTPNEFRGGWEKYAENYCFIANSYYVPYEQEIPTDLNLRTDHISYYRWVPILLAIQALLFWLPNWLWNMLHKQTAVNPRSIVTEALRSRDTTGSERDKEVENLAAYIVDVLSVFHHSKKSKEIPRSGYNATVLYLFIKLLYVLNVIGQLILLNKFLGSNYFSWGYQQFANIVQGEEWKESEIFPRVIMCDFVVRQLANSIRHTIQCVVMMNMINEKLYFFLYFWFIFVGVTTLINFFYYLTVLSIPYLRTKFILYNINRKEQKLLGMKGKDLNYFVQKFLRPDGVLLLQFIRQHIGGRVTYDLLNELLRLYWIKECHPNDDDTTITTKSSPISDKTPRNNNCENKTVINNYQQGEDFVDENTYKPTIYGHSGLYPLNSNNEENIQENKLPLKEMPIIIDKEIHDEDDDDFIKNYPNIEIIKEHPLKNYKTDSQYNPKIQEPKNNTLIPKPVFTNKTSYPLQTDKQKRVQTPFDSRKKI